MAEAPDPRLALALDVGDLDRALALARAVRPHFGVAKVGLELFGAVGPDAVRAMVDLGFDVFCDLKLHDIPTTVARAAEALGRLGVRYVTMHTVGGAAMLHAGVVGLRQTAPTAMALGVTVLTSDATATTRTLTDRVHTAIDAGCGGVVCAAPDLPVVVAEGPALVRMVPGIRPAGTAHDDQARVATPSAAIEAGASVLVIGRAVTTAADPSAAAAAVAAEIAGS